jgi:hypothetical protein
MKISVTERHINNGHAKDSHHCMIADAIKESIPAALYIMVDLQSIRYTDPKKGQRFTYMTPAAAQRNLLKFDRGDKTLRPFTFSLNSPKVRAVNTKTNSTKKAKRRTAAHLKKYAYLAANRERLKRDREFGLRKFAEE